MIFCAKFYFSAQMVIGNANPAWRSGVKSAMLAASQLYGRGPTDVDVAPVPAH